MTSRWRPRSIGRRRPVRTTLIWATVALSVVTGLAGCGSKDPTPEQIRDDARQQLVDGGATPAQAKCISARISDHLLETLSKGDEVDRTSKDFQAYSDAVVACSSRR
jgi:predicted small lipoprotein YifL